MIDLHHVLFLVVGLELYDVHETLPKTTINDIVHTMTTIGLHMLCTMLNQDEQQCCQLCSARTTM